jgi:Flp pilus assembly pilin Flp
MTMATIFPIAALRRALRRLRRDRRGVAAIEAALAIGFLLIPLCLGMIDIATELNEAARLDRALQSATFYVWANPGSFTTAGVQSAAQVGYGAAAPPLAVATSTACSCVSSGYAPSGSAILCLGLCPLGQKMATYLTISLTSTLALPVPLAPLASTAGFSVQGTIRTQ